MLHGYTAEKVKYSWSSGSKEALKLHEIRLPDFEIREAYVTSHIGVYATGCLARSPKREKTSKMAENTVTSMAIFTSGNYSRLYDMISIILTITFLLFSYNEVMPRVSYIKAMDVYLGVCFCIVFFSLIKLALIKYMRERLRITR
uniref:Neurotransmitter-gated ion-channel transmembrane domain-containing protein n=1 Tax=Parascaris equorum TaxID=6256 RepID=A0A914S0H5_PAREQ